MSAFYRPALKDDQFHVKMIAVRHVTKSPVIIPFLALTIRNRVLYTHAHKNL